LTLWLLYFGTMVGGHYVLASTAWTRRELYEEHQNVLNTANTYLQAEADRKYLQTRRQQIARDSVLFPEEIIAGKIDPFREETQFKTRWVRPAPDPARQWDYVQM